MGQTQPTVAFTPNKEVFFQNANLTCPCRNAVQKYSMKIILKPFLVLQLGKSSGIISKWVNPWYHNP